MDDFTSRIEELNSKIPNRIAASGSQHNLALPMENGNGSLLSLSSSASQLIRESPLMEEVRFCFSSILNLILELLHPNRINRASDAYRRFFNIYFYHLEQVVLVARGQRQMMHQMDTLSNLIREYVGERSRIERLDSNRTNSTTQNLEVVAAALPVVLALAIGCLGVFAYSRLK